MGAPRARRYIQPVHPNWFIGLRVLGGDFLSRLAAPEQVRLFAADDLHITVAFLGNVSEQRARDCFACAHDFPLSALTTQLGAVVPLGPRRRPSAFSALPLDFRGAIESAMELSGAALCDQAGVPRQTRPALAHVTLARASRRATPEQVAAASAWASALDLSAAPVRIESIALYTWSLDRTRALFRIVAETSRSGALNPA